MIRLDNQIPRKSIRGWRISNIFALEISEVTALILFPDVRPHYAVNPIILTKNLLMHAFRAADSAGGSRSDFVQHIPSCDAGSRINAVRLAMNKKLI